MPVSPFPITVTVYDTDNTTLKQGVKVYAHNITKNSNGPVLTTNVSGIALLDLANLPITSGQTVPYAIGDKILIIAFYNLTHDAALYTVAGSSKSQTLYLNPSPHNYGATYDRIKSFVVSNTSSTVYYAEIYALSDGQLMSHVECPANDTRSVYYDNLRAGGGHVIVREAKDLIAIVATK